MVASCDFGLRDPDASFEEKTCGSTDISRDPSPAVTEVTRVLSGSARRLDDGSIEVVIAPLLGGLSGQIEAELDPAEMTVEVSGEIVGEFELSRVDAQHVAPVDIVFVLDTTASMAWAIDGVQKGIEAFLDGLELSGIDARVGGIEFGDEVRTHTPLGSAAQLRAWLDKMSAVGGGDGPENPLDAMEEAWSTFDFRPGALRYFIVVTDTGLHELSDGSECAETTLSRTTELMKGEILLTVVHAKLGSSLGVDPSWLTRALGGLYVQIDALKAVLSFDISLDTPADDVLEATHVLRIPGDTVAADADQVLVAYGGSAGTFAIE